MNKDKFVFISISLIIFFLFLFFLIRVNIYIFFGIIMFLAFIGYYRILRNLIIELKPYFIKQEVIKEDDSFV